MENIFDPDSKKHSEEYIDFQKYWLVLKRRWLPAAACFIGLTAAGTFVSLKLPKIYQAEAKLLIKSDSSSKLTGLENDVGKIEGLTYRTDPLITQAEIIKSRQLIEQLIAQTDLKNDSGEALKYEDIAAGLQITPVEKTDVMQIVYTNEDPEKAALVVNKAIDLYIEKDASNNRDDTASAREFIAQQLPEVENKVKEAEANLRSFKNQNGIASLAEETSAYVASLSNISSQINGVEAELEDINAQYSKLQSQLDIGWQEATAISSLSQSLPVIRVLEQLQEVKVALAQKRNYLSEQAPQTITLKEEEADLTALLNREINKTLGNEKQYLLKNINILSLGELKREQIAEFANLGLRKEGLEKKLIKLKNTYNSYQQNSNKLPRLKEQQRELERRVEAAESAYQILLGKFQETQIAERQEIGNVRIVSKAVVPEDPVGPQKKLIVAGSGAAGAALGLVIAFWLDLRDKKIKNSQEVKQIMPYSIQGIIPDYNKIGKNQALLSADNSTAKLPQFAAITMSNPFLKEAYHSLQIKLELSSKNIEQRVVAVTSSVPKEGKSLNSANLALAKVSCNQKVLLIDADLRCPTQHNLWQVDNQRGLSDVLQQGLEWQEVIHKSAISNLDVLTAGSKVENPVALLKSPLMEALICSVSGIYDCIVFDTPPLVGLADSIIINKLVDGILLVVRPGVADYASVVETKNLLSGLESKILGVVINGVDLSKEPYGYGYYQPDKKYMKAN